MSRGGRFFKQAIILLLLSVGHPTAAANFLAFSEARFVCALGLSAVPLIDIPPM